MASTSQQDSINYKLRCTLRGHTSDVRAVTVAPDGSVITASRDFTARLWKQSTEKSAEFSCITEFKGHTSYITAVCVVPPSSVFPEGLVITGSRDTNILVYKPSAGTAVMQLRGHKDTVSCLSTSGDVLASGSWDHSAMVWSLAAEGSDSFPRVAELKAHTGPLWSVLVLPSNQGILTASADTSILLWKNNAVSMKFMGHSDCVRGLALLTPSSFLSCSNDASIRHWDILTGLCVATYYGHSNFIYSISCVTGASIAFVTGAEDRTVGVWGHAGQRLQTIHLPCQSAWSVAACPNSDIVVGTSDGACRIFTLAPELMASEEELKNFAEEVASSARPAAAELGGVDPSKLPDKLALHKPGTKDGQTLMVKEDGKVMCYSWCAPKMQWEAVGEVVGGTGGSNTTSGKVLFEGREYDYVFNVELDEGGALKLPYNNSEDPYMVAQKFIDQHQLPQDHLDQVANFIISNSKASAGPPPPSDYFDPFTGGNRYVPFGDSGKPSAVRGSDPFTSSGRYIPSSSAAQQRLDPPVSTHFPQTTPLLFESCNVNGITSKFKENNKFVESSVRLDDNEVKRLLDAIFTDNEASPNIEGEHLGPLEKALQWAPEYVWPSLDLLRLCLRCRTVQNMWIFGTKGENIVLLLLKLFSPSSNPATKLLALRCLSNLAAHSPGCEQLKNLWTPLITCLTSQMPLNNKNLEIAAATLLLNFSVLFLNSPSQPLEVTALVEALHLQMQSSQEPEAMYRTLVAVGTLLSKGWALSEIGEMGDMLGKIGASSGHPKKVTECAQQIMAAIVM